MSKRAVILAGGQGTRLKPYTVVLPKPLMPLGECPILEVIIRQLAHAKFDHITLAVNHQAEIIKAFCQDGERWGIRIDYSLEQEALGTMGPIKLIRDLPEHFLVMNGDILTDLNYGDFYDTHVKANELFTISSYVREELVDYGVLETGGDELTTLREKPRMQYEVSMGVYMMSREALSFIPNSGAFGFDQLMHRMVKDGKKVRVKRFGGYWLDIGRPADYTQAIEEFGEMKSKFLHD